MERIVSIKYSFPKELRNSDVLDELISKSNELYFKAKGEGIKDAEAVLLKGTTVKVEDK